ncbi:MAG: hypothetical protein U0234_08955 [Sandaracinus sp.]
MTPARSSRRILAAVLPEVAVTLARRRVPGCTDPLVAIVDPESAVVAAADASARRLGVRIGQGAAAASVRASSLRVVHVSREEIESELELVLEVLAAFGPTVAHRLDRGAEQSAGEASARDPTDYDDTAWVDVTGATALAGGENALAESVRARIDALGHAAKLGLASGPRIARALARASRTGLVIARNAEHERRLFGALPLGALSLDARAHTFFRRVGLVTVADLVALPRAQVSARLEGGAAGRAVIDLLEGRDDVPLLAWVPARVVKEAQAFEEGVTGTEGLVFVLRGMTSRLAARLTARGEATGKLVLRLGLDPGIVRHLAREAEEHAPAGEEGKATDEVVLAVGLPVPLSDPEALLRTLVPSLERVEVAAPVVRVELRAEEIAHARRDQLDLSRGRGIDPNRLRHLAAELGAEVGEGRVGFVQVLDAHRPEKRARLVLDGAAVRTALARELAPPPEDAGDALVPMQLLAEPARIERFVVGGRVVIEGRAHRVEHVAPLARLEGVEWWARPVSREYVRVALVSEAEGERSEALVFHDRIAKATFLHGWME